MVKSITTVIFFWGGLNAGFSQENGAVINGNEKPFIAAPLGLAKGLPIEGTYQIAFKNGSAKHEIHEDILLQINEKRDAENTVIIAIDENTEIRILPYTTINSDDFVVVPTYVFE